MSGSAEYYYRRNTYVSKAMEKRPKADLYKRSDPHAATQGDKTGKVAKLRTRIGCSAEIATELLEHSNWDIEDAIRLCQVGISKYMPDAAENGALRLKYEIWRAGSPSTPISTPIKIKKLGEAYGTTFAEACYKALKDQESFDFKTCAHYGLKLYATEAEAQEATNAKA